MLAFAADARDAFERFETKLNRERRQIGGNDEDDAGLFLGWLSKLAGQTARLASVLHAAQYWTGGIGTMATTIDLETTRQAIRLAGYYREQALIAFGLMGQLPEQRRALTILCWLHQRSDEELETLTVRDIHRTRTKGTTVTQVRAALRLLEGHGHLRVKRQQASSEGGRPSERVHVHPSIRNRHDPPDETDKTPSWRRFCQFCRA